MGVVVVEVGDSWCRCVVGEVEVASSSTTSQAGDVQREHLVPSVVKFVINEQCAQ